MAEMVRVNTRISKQLNDWLDTKSNESGVPKSTLIYLALENYMREQVMMSKMDDIRFVMEKMEEMSKGK